MQTTELQVRKETNGLMADGLLLGLWVGNLLVSTEYWLLRGGDLAVHLLRAVFTRPLRLAFAFGAVAAGALALGSRSETGSARIASAALDEKLILNAAALHRANTGRWPVRLEALVPKYLKELPSDPWGRNYSIFRGEGGFAVVSAGPDGENGTNDDLVRVGSNKSVTCPSSCGNELPGNKTALGCPDWAVVPGVGVKLRRLGPGVLAAAGLEQNDIVTRVNGLPLSSLEAVLKAYPALREADPFDVEILRNDRPIRMVIGRDYIESHLQGQ